VGYIDVSDSDKDRWEYTNIGFTDFDYGQSKAAMLPNDTYIPLSDSIGNDQGRFSMSAEPEHIVVDRRDTFAYIGLQESNAIAVLDIEAKEVTNVFTLGLTDFGRNGGLDASDKDGGINITEYSNLYGMRQPDDIEYWHHRDGRSFIFTANEGDSKGWDEARVEDMILDADTFGNGSDINDLQRSEQLGRLKVSKLLGTMDGFQGLNESEYESLITFSSRDFTVFEVKMDGDRAPMDLVLHFSSGNDFETITAQRVPEGFNSDYTTGTFDERSDAKGPEPEALTIGECGNGRLYVFIAFERVGGVIVYDFTDIDDIVFVDYVNSRNFSANYPEEMEDQRPPENAGDIGPEQMRFIPEDIYGEPLLVVSYPQSASIAMYRIDCGDDPEIPTPGPKEGGRGQDGELSTWEYVAIGVGSLAILSIVAVAVYIGWRKKKAVNVYRYASRDHGHLGYVDAEYVEMEN